MIFDHVLQCGLQKEIFSLRPDPPSGVQAHLLGEVGVSPGGQEAAAELLEDAVLLRALDDQVELG